MIVNRADAEFQGDDDIFSLAGRLALVGGGAFAINKTLSEFKRMDSFVGSPYSNEQIANIAEMLDTTKETAGVRKKVATNIVESEFFPKGMSVPNPRSKTIAGLDEVKAKFTGGFNKHSEGLGEAVENFYSAWTDQFGGKPEISYFKDEANNITQVSFRDTETGKSLRFEPVSLEGTITTGSSGQNIEAVNQVYETQGMRPVHKGADVAKVEAMTEGLADFKSGILTQSDFNRPGEVLTKYEGKNYIGGDLKGNQEILQMKRGTSKPNPWKPQKSAEAQAEFMEIMSREGNVPMSASAAAQGSLAVPGHPIFEGKRPFLEETANPYATTRNVQHTTFEGNIEYTTEKRALYLDKERMDILHEIRAEKGKPFKPLGAEQAILNKPRAGTITDTTRSLKVAEGQFGEAANFLFSQIAEITKQTPLQVSENLAKGYGIDIFGPGYKADIQKIPLDALGKQKHAEVRAKRKEIAKLESSTIDTDVKKAKVDILNKELEVLKTQREEAKFFGFKSDGIESQMIKKGHEGMTVEDIFYNEGDITVKGNMTKAVGISDKVQEHSGSLKVIIAEEMESFEDVVETERRYQARRGVKLSLEEEKALRLETRTADYIASRDILKETLQDRTSVTVFEGVHARAIRDHNTALIKLFEDYDHKGTPREEHVNFFSRVESVLKNQGINETAESYSIQKIAGLPDEKGIVARSYKVAYGQSAVDMGTGNIGSISRAHLKTMSSYGGLDNFIEDVYSRRLNPESMYAAQDLERTLDLLRDPKFKNGIPIEDNIADLRKVLFPTIGSDPAKAMRTRKFFLKNQGFEGTGILDLGVQIKAKGTKMGAKTQMISRLPIFNEEFYRGFVGAQIGAKADKRHYTDLEESIQRILGELNKEQPDQKVLEKLGSRYLDQFDTMRESLTDSIAKAKIQGSYYGMIDTAPEATEAYADAMIKRKKTKHAMPLVGVASEEKFIDIFGRERHTEIMEQAKKIRDEGGYTKRLKEQEDIIKKKTRIDTDLRVKKGKSKGKVIKRKPNAQEVAEARKQQARIQAEISAEYAKKIQLQDFAMVTRDPALGHSHLPMGVLPSSLFPGSNIKGGFGVITGDKRGFELLKAVFGDFDGDEFQIVAASKGKSTNELMELAFGKSQRAQIYRQVQIRKAVISENLKAKQKGDYRTTSKAERSQTSLMAKMLEKKEVGSINKSLEPAREAIQSTMRAAGASKDWKSYSQMANLTNVLHILEETAIKGKHQTFEELKERNTIKIMEALLGKGAYAKASEADRVDKVIGFFDELGLSTVVENQHISEVGDYLRSVEPGKIDGEKLRKLEGIAILEAREASDGMGAASKKGVQDEAIAEIKRLAKTGYWQEVADKGHINVIQEMVETGKGMNMAMDDALKVSLDISDEAAVKVKQRNEKITRIMKESEDVMLKGSKNLGMYALAPVAIIGIAGSLLGGTSEMEKRGKEDYSDGSKGHRGGAHSAKPRFSEQMRRPKYERMNITGEADSASLNYGAMGRGDSARIMDHRKTLDKYEIQDIIDRGI